MYNELLRDGKQAWMLLAIDEEMAATRKTEGCGYCGGRLHRGDYGRKARGVASSEEAYRVRFSFSCAVEDCRRRATPPSVRFLGRRVYVALAVVLGTIIGHGSKPRRVEELQKLIGFRVDRRTVERWRRWWRQGFPKTKRFKALQGLLKRPVSKRHLPASLLEAFVGADVSARVVRLLRQVSAPAM